MKYLFYLIIASFLFMPNVFGNEIKKINMDIYINNNGSASIKEVWNVYSDNGTEIYKTYNNVNPSQFKNFKVSLNDREFTNIDSWNLNATFKEKAYKSGINIIKDGLELCFGISEYGSHDYIFEYTIDDFIVNLTDSQMLYWTLVPKNISDIVEDVYIRIYSDFVYENSLEVWGFGKYGAVARVYNGYIELSAQNLSSNEHMTTLVRFKSNIYNVNSSLNYDFSHYLEMAKKDSKSYEKTTKIADTYDDKKPVSEKLKSFIVILLAIITSIILFLPIIIKPKKNRKTSSLRSKRISDLSTNVKFFRDVPKGDLFSNYYIADFYRITKKDTDFLGSILLKWLQKGYITIEKINKNPLLKNQIITAIKIGKVIPENELEQEIYEIIKKAAKGDYLEKNEFKKWSQKHYGELFNWFDDIKEKMLDEFIKQGLITKKIVNNCEEVVEDDKVFIKASELNGLKAYLEVFSNMKDKAVIDVHLWQDYLIYAQMFGIAKKVAAQFKKMYPEIIADFNFDLKTVYMISDFAASAVYNAKIGEKNRIVRTEKINKALKSVNNYSSGGGGRSSGGGGGGSFGGGSGGGGFR